MFSSVAKFCTIWGHNNEHLPCLCNTKLSQVGKTCSRYTVVYLFANTVGLIGKHCYHNFWQNSAHFCKMWKVFGIFRGAFRFGQTCEAFPLLPNGQMSASSKEPGCIGTQSQAFPALRHPLYHSADLTPEQCFVRGLLKFVFRQNLQK